jgi:hypothetical protein
MSRRSDKLEILLAHRPNVSYPTFAAGGAEADIYGLWG